MTSAKMLVLAFSVCADDGVTPNVGMVGIVIVILPLVLIYPLAQTFFVCGITLGSVKK